MALTTVQGQMLTAPLTLTGNLTFSDGSVQTAAASPYVLKNRIINGAMQIWQRGTSFASTAGYTTDRWSTIGYGSYNETVSQSTSVPTTAGNAFQYSLKLQRPASSTGTIPVLIGQAIESVNCYDLSSQTVTLSFWARAGANYSSSGSTLTTQLVTGTTADQGITSYATWAGYASPISNASTILTTSWQKFSYTATLGSGILEAAIIFYFTPSGTAGADDSAYITGVQLEVGSTATPFERRLYNQELANCQRYFEMSFEIGTAPSNGGASTFSTNNGLAQCVAMNGSYGGGWIPWKVTKRATPTVTTYGNSSGYWGWATNSGALTFSTSTISGTASQNGYTVSQQVSNNAFALISGHYTVSAEL